MKKLSFLFSYFMILFGLFLNFGTDLEAAEFPLQASYAVDTSWATAYQSTITVKNTSSSPTSSWIASFTMPQGYSLSPNLSPGGVSVNGQNVTVKSSSKNGVIAAGGTAAFKILIVMPISAPTVINNLQAVANATTTPPPPPPPPVVPVAPVLKAIEATSAQNFTVSWNSVTNATSYTLQQATTNNFTNPQTVAQGNIVSKVFTNQENGVYYYRVLATNASGNSPFSNVQSITVSQPTPIPPVIEGIEHSAWYIDWTSWFNGPPFVIPSNNNVLNIFVGALMYGSDDKPTMGGFGNMTLPQMDLFTAYCAAQQPPIGVKVSIGGFGGMYDHCWDLLKADNVHAFAQGLVDFCHAHGLIGVDFDYEAFSSDEQENLVGMLIKEFKTIDPNLESSLCSNAGFGPNFPWQAAVQNILNAATMAPGHSAVDRFYIMSYYNSMQEEQNWINGWADWLITNYGFTPARVAVGIDDYDAHAYDPVAFAAWAATMGYSTAHWAFDPARPIN
ncbi:MAG: cellulose binding domain-containing protein [Parachlamydiaceae bacterium]|nr:cellulose binding domain-containing protein [Parachlamydiaceae bacterium]